MVIKSSLQTRKRCYNHPHRETELTCERCKTCYCAQCLVEDEGKKLCAICQSEAAAARAAVLTPREKVIESFKSLARGLIVVGVFLVLGIGVFFLYRNNFDRPLTPEELARFRYAMTGSFETEEGLNASSTVLGAVLLSATSEAEGYLVKSLINEYTGPGAPPWRSTGADFPQEVVIKFDSPSSISKVNLINSPTEPVETYVKEFEVLLSLEGPDRGYSSVGRFEAAQASELQRFTFPEVRASYVKLRILSSYGSPDYISLDEFNAYVIPSNPIFRSTASPGTSGPATPSAVPGVR